MPKMQAYDSFDDYLAAQSPAHRRIIAAVRKFVGAEAPQLAEAVKWGNGCWVLGKVPVAYVYSDTDHVQFGFMTGSRLADPGRRLLGQGQYIRHLKLHAVADVEPEVLAPYLRQAIRETPEKLSDLSTPKRAKSKKKAAKKAPKATKATKATQSSKAPARPRKKVAAKQERRPDQSRATKGT
jgi:hypothetical protein